MIRKLFIFALLPLAALQTLSAANVSLSGNFTRDDNVQLFSFSLSSASTVTLKTLSYAGGVNAAGMTVLQNGFDPALSLFNSMGLLIGASDDGACDVVGIDSVSGLCFDAYLQTSLTAGTYTLALTQFDNEANGPNLSNGFYHQGEGNFTGPAFGPVGATGPFYDLFGNQRTSLWAVDLMNVSSAGAVNAVPEPATFTFAAIGILVAGMAARGSKKTN